MHTSIEVADDAVELRDRLVGLRLHVSPFEGVTVAKRSTVPLSPLRPETTIVELVVAPAMTAAGVLMSIAKSCITIVAEAVRVSPLLVAVVVTV